MLLPFISIFARFQGPERKEVYDIFIWSFPLLEKKFLKISRFSRFSNRHANIPNDWFLIQIVQYYRYKCTWNSTGSFIIYLCYFVSNKCPVYKSFGDVWSMSWKLMLLMHLDQMKRVNCYPLLFSIDTSTHFNAYVSLYTKLVAITHTPWPSYPKRMFKK